MNKQIQTISVIGLGYIGLPTAAMFASRKIKVVGVDVNQHAVDTINAGKIHIVEPELDMLVHASVKEGYLRATTKPEPADAFLIAVPTPFKNDYEPDLAYVESAAKSIAPVLQKGNIVILESTSPVGTTEKMMHWLAEARPDLKFPIDGQTDIDIHISYCPERVLPGRVVHELVDNDRIIGGITPECSQRAAQVYQIFVQGQLLFTNVRTAEMSKLAENAFRDVNIAFANELSLIADKLDINVWELIKLANRHPRVNILQPGAGVGGHCIAVDPWFIVHKTPEQAKLIRAAREVNDHKPKWVLGKIHEAVAGLVAQGKKTSAITIAFLGLSFKPNIDDLRESPALHIVEEFVLGLSIKPPVEDLRESSALHIVQEFASTMDVQLKLVEPNIAALPKSLNAHALSSIFEQGVLNADIVVLLVNHQEFKGIKEKLGKHVILIDAVGSSYNQ
ncbi:UDP-N-acetyl-D-mannosaminuronic acid dehydrogenase [Oxalobacteraceae bacterium GrIS 2.11]